jgi:histidine triad (HIT) family protein
VGGEIPTPLLHDGERVVAFTDLHPQAATHVLVVPRGHHRDVVALAGVDPQTLAELVAVGGRIAAAEAGGEFTLLFNTGASAGQTVFHAHGHVLGGARWGWAAMGTIEPT